jgi:[ribosomal protein S5]-alanine N-acetyltransferase
MIETDRLILIPCTREHLEAFARSHGELGLMIDATVPEAFPVMPESFAYWLEVACRTPLPVGWANWIFIHKPDRTVIGDGGFKGTPDTNGNFEIGYAIIAAYRRNGFAREAAHALVAWAFSHPDVTAVNAETLATGEASMRVLQSIGMERTGEYVDPAEGTILQWQVKRAAFETP